MTSRLAQDTFQLYSHRLVPDALVSAVPGMAHAQQPLLLPVQGSGGRGAAWTEALLSCSEGVLHDVQLSMHLSA